MRESKFIQQNKNKWQEFEQMLQKGSGDPDRISDLFIQITDDLSFARTNYPNRTVRYYLNNLAQNLFDSIYKNRKSSFKNFRDFWTEKLPKAVYDSRKELLLALLIFLVSLAIGIFSTHKDPDFPKSILGESYVEMTKENIRGGDPMAVYKKMNQVDMFLGITFNNLLVAFRTFVSGIFLAIGTIVILLYNGIMVGTFQYFFYQKGLFMESFLTIWLHGTIEISSIIIAGGAGLKLGSGLIFPGTYTRFQSFRLSAKKGLTVMMGVAPLLVFAALIESFITRYTEVPDWIKLSLILISLTFVVGYFVVLPYFKAKAGQFREEEERLVASNTSPVEFNRIYSNGEIFTNIFVFYKKSFEKIIALGLLLAIVFSIVSSFLLSGQVSAFDDKYFFVQYLFDYSLQGGMGLAICNFIFITIMLLFAAWPIMSEWQNNQIKVSGFILNSLVKAIVTSLIIQPIFMLHPGLITLILIMIGPVILLFYFTYVFETNNISHAISKTSSLVSGNYGRLLLLSIVLALSGAIYYFLIESPVTLVFYEAINWNVLLSEEEQKMIFILFKTFTAYLALALILPVFYYGLGLSYFSLKEIREANYLKERISNFGIRSRNVFSK